MLIRLGSLPSSTWHIILLPGFLLRLQEEAHCWALGFMVKWEGGDAWVDLGIQENHPIFLLLPINARESTDFKKKKKSYSIQTIHFTIVY